MTTFTHQQILNGREIKLFVFENKFNPWSRIIRHLEIRANGDTILCSKPISKDLANKIKRCPDITNCIYLLDKTKITKEYQISYKILKLFF